MAVLGLTFPNHSQNNTIVGTLSSDNNLRGLQGGGFALRRADNNVQLGSSISIGSRQGSAGSWTWSITVTNPTDYRGAVFLRMNANSAFDDVDFGLFPTSPLDSNHFRFSFNPATDPPQNFKGVAEAEKITVSWDEESGQTYEVRQGSEGWEDATSPHEFIGLTPATEYTFQVRVKGDTPGSPSTLTISTLAFDAPTGFSGTASDEFATLLWDIEDGKTYEVRVNGGDWTDAVPPYVALNLTPQTQYTFDVRIKATDTIPAGNIATIMLTTSERAALPPGDLFIEAIDEQFIPIRTEDYELIIRVNRLNIKASVVGLQEGFYQSFRKLENGNSEVIIRAKRVTRLLEKAVWKVEVEDLDDGTTADREIIYNVVAVAPILLDPGPQTMYKGINFELLVEVLNEATVQRGESELVGLKFDAETVDERAYVKSAGVLPMDANLTFESFFNDYYVENGGGSDTLQVPVTLREDAVAPVIRAISNVSRNTDYAGFTIQASVSAGTPPIMWSVEGPEGVTIDDMGLITVPGGLGVGTHSITVTASNGLYEDTEQFSLSVRRPVVIVITPPVIRAIPNVGRTVGYSQFTVQASLSSGSSSTWSVSGAGATISTSGLITIPAGLGIGTHTITARADNSGGFDTESFFFSVSAAAAAPVIRAISNVARTVGYSQFTIQASVSTGTSPINWRVSGIAGATISTSGLITIPAGLSQATHTATVTASNSVGSDTEQFSVEVSAAAPTLSAPSGTITLAASAVIGESGRVNLGWGHPNNRGTPTSSYSVYRSRRTTESFRRVRSGISGTSYSDGRVGGTRYAVLRFYIRAVNSEGFLQSNTITLGWPDPPVLSTSFITKNTFMLNISAPSDTGGLPILRYGVSVFDDLTNEEVYGQHVTESVRIEGLRPGRAYTVSAFSDNGYSTSLNNSTIAVTTAS